MAQTRSPFAMLRARRAPNELALTRRTFSASESRRRLQPDHRRLVCESEDVSVCVTGGDLAP